MNKNLVKLLKKLKISPTKSISSSEYSSNFDSIEEEKEEDEAEENIALPAADIIPETQLPILPVPTILPPPPIVLTNNHLDASSDLEYSRDTNYEEDSSRSFT